MSDMSAVIVPKSDQINADDLIGGDLTIRITAVSVSPGQEQPVSMKFEGSAKVYRPCKSMARVMVAAWGPDSSAYVGRSLQLYRDPSVKWGGMDVGGIRIRKMTHMPDDRPMTMALTATKGSRKLYTVQPLVVQVVPTQPATMTSADALYIAKRAAEKGVESFRAWFNTDEGKDCRKYGPIAIGSPALAELQTIASGADAMRAMPDPLADMDPLPPVPTDAEIQAQIDADHRAAMAADEARMAGEG